MKKILSTIIVLTLLFSLSLITNAASDNTTFSMNGRNYSSSAFAARNSVSISSSVSAGTVSGAHKIWYRVAKTSTSNLITYSERKTFNAPSSSIIKNNLYIVDYTKGSHSYYLSGSTHNVSTLVYY